MADISVDFTSIEQAFTAALSATISYLPQLIATLAILILGWAIARIVRSMFNRIGDHINRLLERVFKSGALASVRFSQTAIAIIAEIIFWVVMFVTVTIAAQTAGFSGLSDLLSDFVKQIPNLLIGAGIIFIGYFVSVLVGDQVELVARSANAGRSVFLKRIAQSVIFLTALIIGLDQIGVNVTFIIALFVVTVGTAFAGVSLAFGLGAADFVKNMMGARSARRALTEGQTVRIGNVEGEVLEITDTHIALETAEGKALLPAHLALTDVIVSLALPTDKADTSG
jgi:flagellar biosynthesis protein FliQ